MNKVYPAVFHSEDNGYWVDFPDLPGCFSEGDSITEAVTEASAALGAYLCSMIDRNEPLPEPSDIHTIAADGADFASLVSADPLAFQTRTRSIKKTLTLPEWLNDAAEQNHINFSSVLQEALKRQLGLA